jgi:hypothetical protein
VSRERESGQNINPSEGTELTPVEKSRQKIVDHLKNAELQSTRFLAFELYVRAQLAESFSNDVGGTDTAKIADRLSRRRDFEREYEEIHNVVSDYNRELTEGIPDPREGWQTFARALYNIYDTRKQEITRKTQESQPSGFFNRFYQRFKR